MVIMILLIMVGVQIIGNYLFAESFYTKKKSQIIEQAYEELKDCEGKKAKMMEIMKRYEIQYNLQFLLANNEQVCIYNSNQQDFKIWNNQYRVRSDFSFRKNFYRFSSMPEPVVLKRNNGNGKVVLFGIVHAKKTNYYVVVQSHLQSVRANMYESGELLVYFSLVALGISSVIAYFFAKKISIPIQEMDRVARRVSSLDFSHKVKIRKKKMTDELDRLAVHINKMSDEIEQNIEQLKEENRYRQKMEQTRKAFIANVSHELKTPLSILSGYVQMLQIAEKEIDKTYYCDVILDETRRMTELVNHLLGLARMEQDVTQANMEEVLLSELVREEIQKRLLLFSENQITVELDIEDECYVKGNEEYLKIILNNYISNAVSHICGERILKVVVRKEGEEILLSVFNTGENIQEESLSKIWDSFYQEEESHTRVGKDTHIGLGLYIVRLLVNAHQGKYGVENKENGVNFWILLKNN